ncbi:MAG: hypothetical protein JXB88_25325 [Spirochaetales bacterium]|nr:hypothetical protein [Spirochaetales bacterium]
MSKSKLRCMCFMIIFILNVPVLFAQLNEQIDLLMEQEKASFGRAVYLVLVASEFCDESVTLAGALEILKGKDWGIPPKEAEDTLTLGEYSYLLMRAFNIQGGIMYKILPGPRYAVRELAYLKLILENPEPGRIVSGEEVMSLLTRVLSWKEGE